MGPFISTNDTNNNLKKKKIVVILGATGTGKSRLSLDLAIKFYGEIINSDKIQLYSGLDITTNKLPPSQRNVVPHHLLGEIPVGSPELSPLDYRSIAENVISRIWSHGKVPILVGGSNSFIYALLTRRFDPDMDVFQDEALISLELRYECCFIWMDVAPLVLDSYLEKRVDEMVEDGMVNELGMFFDSEGVDEFTRPGLRRSIGVSEFRDFFRTGGLDMALFEKAVGEVKENTIRLARRQVQKIMIFREGGWELQRIDATEVLREKVEGRERCSDVVWEKNVMEPCVKIVKSFLDDDAHKLSAKWKGLSIIHEP